MNAILALTKKELKVYFNSSIAYIFIIVFLAKVGWLFFRGFFLLGQISQRAFFEFLPWVFLFLIPAVTMRLWSEEKKMGTIETLMTLPVTETQTVIGKFLASFFFLLLTLLLSSVLTLILAYLGEPDFGVIFASYLGALFMGSAYLAIGLWVSSFTENQIIAFIVAVAISFAMFILGESIVTMALPQWIVPTLQYLGLGTHFSSITRGVIDSRDVIYYLSVIGFFLYLNVLNIKKRS